MFVPFVFSGQREDRSGSAKVNQQHNAKDANPQRNSTD